jgi:rubrerythrin
VSEALSWTGNKSAAEILEFAIGLEANSYDLYIKMGRRVADKLSVEVFSVLSEDEKKHLERLSILLDKKTSILKNNRSHDANEIN